MLLIRFLILFLASTLTACSVEGEVIEYDYRIVNSYPHSDQVFTQGFIIHDNFLYESAGLYNRSRLIKRKLNDIQPEQQHHLPSQYFAEGITLLNDRLYQLTWKSEQGFIYDPDTLTQTGSFTINGQGWGLTTDGQQLIMSNGSAQLNFINPETFTVNRRIMVTHNGQPLDQLNELEWVDGLIYANLWKSNLIVIINPNSGQVVATADLSKLLNHQLKTTNINVLNGIAYDPKQQRLFVTGKFWPRLYQIELLTKASTSSQP